MAIGIICEYNPFHNGHIYFLNEIKKKYPNDLLILCLNGYFLERGEISLLTKQEKTNLALSYGIDLVIELPVLYGTQAADAFSECAITLLSSLNVSHIIFGSESNDIKYLTRLAKKQLQKNFQISAEKTNYPARLGLSLKENRIEPNDILGICYIKAILKQKKKMTYETIKRTNNYHDLTSTSFIVSASNIREKIKNKIDISAYLPENVQNQIHTLDEKKYFAFLKQKIATDPHLEAYLDVNEGLEWKLKSIIVKAKDYQNLVSLLKSKRYTYNRIHRMLIHIFLGILKTDAKVKISYVHILGFNKKGQKYLKENKKEFALPLKIEKESKIYQYEKQASLCYDLLMNENTLSFEQKNQPIIICSKEESQK